MSVDFGTSVDGSNGSRRGGKLGEKKLGNVVQTATIAPLVSRCFSSFERLRESIIEKEPKLSDEITSSEISDAIGRFRVWSSNIGAHKTGGSSLEYRLRDASHLRERVQALLQSLNGFIEDGTAIIKGEKTAWDKLPPEPDLDSNSTDDESSDSSNDGSLDDETELRQLMASIKTRITLLMRLSMAIRKPAAHDQFLCSADIDTSHFHEYDIRHVRERFPTASDDVVRRLGIAISKRRQYFKYRGEHAKKLAQGSVLEENDGSTGHQPQSTIASSLPQAVVANPHHLDLDVDEESDTGVSQTSFATSTGDDVEGPRLPPLPKQAKEGIPFECPFCFMLVSIRTKRSWRRHIYKDLQPYVCTYPGCPAAHRLFEGRREWFQHERDMHRHYWTCQAGCSQRFYDRNLFRDHILNEHNVGESTEDRINELEHAAGIETTADCCLCGKNFLSLLHLRNHLGDHQRQLALFALPVLNSGDDSEDDDASVHTSEGSLNNNSVAGESQLGLVSSGEQSDSVAEGSDDVRAKGSVDAFRNILWAGNLPVSTSLDNDIPSLDRESDFAARENPGPVLAENSYVHITPRQAFQDPVSQSQAQQQARRDEQAVIQNRPLSYAQPQSQAQNIAYRESIGKSEAPLDEGREGKHIPPDARWTKIDRRLVNPGALVEAKERFEERADCVIVLRVLTREEIQRLAYRTMEIREAENMPTEAGYEEESKSEGSPWPDEQVLASQSGTNATSDPERKWRCEQAECVERKGFKRHADLMRHMSTAHDREYQETFDCPKRTCPRKGKNGFTRKDHLKEHLRNFHLQDITKRIQQEKRHGSF